MDGSDSETESPKISTREKKEKYRSKVGKRTLNIPENFFIKREDLVFENILGILIKKSKERLPKELKTLAKYFEFTELSQKFRSDKMSDSSLNRLLNFCAMYLELEVLSPEDYLFRQGDFGDKFYVILKGSINILRIVTKPLNKTPIDYLRFLEYLNRLGHKDLVLKNISDNYDTYFLEYKDINSIDEIIFAVKLKCTLAENHFDINNIISIFTECNRNSQAYGFDISRFKEQRNVDELVDTINEKIFRPITNMMINLKKYCYLEYIKDTRKLAISDNELFLQFSHGKCFGDFALDNQSGVRTATIQCGPETTYLGYITNKVYGEYLLYEKQKIRKKEIVFLLDFAFLTPIGFNNIDRKYFSDFTYQEYARGDIIYIEGEPLEYVYLIKDGEFELSLRKNTIGLINVIENVEKLYHTHFKELINKDSNKIDKNKVLKEKIKNIRVMIYGRKQVLGVSEFFFKQRLFFNCKVFSEKASVFKIKTSTLETIFAYERPCKKKLHSYVQINFQSLIDRLSYILVMNLYSIDKEKVNIIKSEKDIKSSKVVVYPNIISQSQIEPNSYRRKMISMCQADSSLILNNPLKEINYDDTINSTAKESIMNEKEKIIIGIKKKTTINMRKLSIFGSIKIEENRSDSEVFEDDNISHYSRMNINKALKQKISTLKSINPLNNTNGSQIDFESLKMRKFQKHLEKTIIFTPMTTLPKDNDFNGSSNTLLSVIRMNSFDPLECNTDRSFQPSQKNTISTSDRTNNPSKFINKNPKKVRKITSDNGIAIQRETLNNTRERKSTTNNVKELSANLFNAELKKEYPFKHLFKIKRLKNNKNK